MAKSETEKTQAQIPYPTQVDKLTKKAHRTFLSSVTLGGIILVVWASVAEIDTVTRGSGSVIPSLQNQFVQHLEGGLVTEILVREGQEVKTGDVLMRIEDSFTQAEFLRAALEQKASQAALVRLEAETSGATSVIFPKELAFEIPDIVKNENVLFNRNIDGLNEQILILRDQFVKKQGELSEKKARKVNMAREYDLVRQRVESLRRLVKGGAASKNELLQSQTSLQQIKTKLSDLEFQIPQAEAEIREAARREKEIRLKFQAAADKEKADTLLNIAKLKETMSAMQDRKSRTDVRTPISGKVHQLFQTTVGGVVRGGQNLAQIVPVDAAIEVEIKLAPDDRARVWKDLPAIVKVTAYDYSIHGGLPGQITDISSDVLQKENGDPYFRVKIQADVSAFGPEKPVVSGMAVDVDILTGKRSILDYLLGPLHDISEKALRES